MLAPCKKRYDQPRQHIKKQRRYFANNSSFSKSYGFSSSHVWNWLIWKDPDAGKDWRQEEEGMTEDEMGGWHHWFDGSEFEQAPGIGEEQLSLASCSPRGHRVGPDWTELTDLLSTLSLCKVSYYLQIAFDTLPLLE